MYVESRGPPSWLRQSRVHQPMQEEYRKMVYLILFAKQK